jgi:hypothetical protein
MQQAWKGLRRSFFIQRLFPRAVELASLAFHRQMAFRQGWDRRLPPAGGLSTAGFLDVFLGLFNRVGLP